MLLRDARRRAGLSQAELARLAGVTQPVISAYENGRREPGLTMLAKLVDAAGLTLRIVLEPQPDDRDRLPDTPMGRLLRDRREEIVSTLRDRGMTRVRVFGSVARGDDTDSSDVDLMVDSNGDVSLLDLIGTERELSRILGRPVDLVLAHNLKAAVASEALEEAVPL